MLKTILIRASLVVVAGLVMLLPGFNQLSENPTFAQADLIQLTDIRLHEYLLPGAGSWTPVPAGTVASVPATALRLRFIAKVVNRNPGHRIRFKAALHEMCFLTSTKRFISRLQWIESAEPADGDVVRADGTVMIEVPAHCTFYGRARCGKWQV